MLGSVDFCEGNDGLTACAGVSGLERGETGGRGDLGEVALVVGECANCPSGNGFIGCEHRDELVGCGTFDLFDCEQRRDAGGEWLALVGSQCFE